MGDFNARTSNLNDFLMSDDDNFDNSTHMYLKESIERLNDLGIPLKRTNMDCKVNNNGYKLLELCTNFDLRILNGRIGQDTNKGKFTCVSNHANSVVDYIIMSSCLIPRVKDFFIDDFDPCLSDKHTPVSVTLKSVNVRNQSKTQPNQHTSGMTNDPGNNSMKTSWNPTKSNDYTNCFDESHILALTQKVDKINNFNCNQNSIDDACKDLCNLLIDPAKKIGVYYPVKNIKKINFTSQCTNPWFDKKMRLTVKPLNFARDLISLILQVMWIRKIKYPQKFKF